MPESSVQELSNDDLPPTPDFDSYPVPADVVEAAVEAEGSQLRVVWSDGRVSRYHAIWLRDNATDKENLNLDTREQRSDITALPEGIAITAARVEPCGALALRWNVGSVVSRFHPGWLYVNDYSNGAAKVAVDVAPLLWDAETLPEPSTFDGARILEDDVVLEDWLKAVCRQGIARLRNVPCDEGMVARVAARIGPVRDTNFGHVFDVRVAEGPGSNAYSTAALTPHTDLPTREYQPGLQFLHCLRNDSAGGQALMVDGFHLTQVMRDRDPQTFRCLTEIDWPNNNRALDTDYRWPSPVIVLDGKGEVRELRVVPFLRAPLALPFEEVEEAYRALRRFFEAVKDPRYQMRLDYAPGDLVVFDNRRILHGRAAYDERSGERWLQGCYGEREELLSRLRILARQRRARQLQSL